MRPMCGFLKVNLCEIRLSLEQQFHFNRRWLTYQVECPEAGEEDKAESSLLALFENENCPPRRRTAISPSQIVNWKDFPAEKKS